MFTVLNAALLARRIQVEERALATVAGNVAAVR
jgi:isoprenylcysteine carboxyl methyltransferase (ICMT) family protein YpbQ